MEDSEKLHWVPTSIGMLVLACMFGGLVVAVYPGWQEFWLLIKSHSSWNSSSFFNSIAGIGAAFSAFFSWRALVQAREIKQDEELLAHATLTLERSYTALMNESENNSPLNDRLNWLTSARLIINYQDTKKQMKSPEIIRRCEGHEEYWRNQFYESLQSISMQFGYYEGVSDWMGSDQIQPVSAIVVHNFSGWPEGRVDNLDRYANADAAIEELGLSQRWAALRQYVGRS